MDAQFQNRSILGAFGEFVYKQFCEGRGYTVERTNSFHTDFRIAKLDENEHFYVDVKSSIGRCARYRGRRVHAKIIYDRISIVDAVVYLVPDEGSPFKQIDCVIKIGDLVTLVDRWKSSPQTSNKRIRITTDEVRDDLIRAATRKYPRLRFVERGSASRKGWDGTVDNLPGSDATCGKYDATVFIQYGFADENGEFKQPIHGIMLFPHHLIDRERAWLRNPNKRQERKGIKKVVNLKKFACQHPDLVFNGVEELKRHLRGEKL